MAKIRQSCRYVAPNQAVPITTSVFCVYLHEYNQILRVLIGHVCRCLSR